MNVSCSFMKKKKNKYPDIFVISDCAKFIFHNTIGIRLCPSVYFLCKLWRYKCEVLCSYAIQHRVVQYLVCGIYNMFNLLRSKVLRYIMGDIIGSGPVPA